MDRKTSDDTSESASRRKVLAASSAAGAAFFGYGGIVGSASADDEPRVGMHPTPEEFERSLRESDHIGLRRDYDGRVNRDGLSSVDELPTSATPGRDHPEIYFGEFQNAETLSGEYYSVSDGAADVDSGTGPISIDETEIGPSFVSFEEELGCAGMGPFPGKLCASVETGLDLEFLAEGKIGGKLYLDLVFEHSSGPQVTVSPAGFGIYADLDNPVGICLSPTFRAPGPIPGKIDADLCFDYTFTVQGSDLMVGFEFSKLEVCVEDNTFCADILTFSAGFEFKVADVSDVPFLSQGSSAQELPEF